VIVGKSHDLSVPKGSCDLSGDMSHDPSCDQSRVLHDQVTRDQSRVHLDTTPLNKQRTLCLPLRTMGPMTGQVVNPLSGANTRVLIGRKVPESSSEHSMDSDMQHYAIG